jgi:hypothetical protein
VRPEFGPPEKNKNINPSKITFNWKGCFFWRKFRDETIFVHLPKLVVLKK